MQQQQQQQQQQEQKQQCGQQQLGNAPVSPTAAQPALIDSVTNPTRLSPFASMADMPLDSSSSPAPRPAGMGLQQHTPPPAAAAAVQGAHGVIAGLTPPAEGSPFSPRPAQLQGMAMSPGAAQTRTAAAAGQGAHRSPVPVYQHTNAGPASAAAVFAAAMNANASSPRHMLTSPAGRQRMSPMQLQQQQQQQQQQQHLRELQVLNHHHQQQQQQQQVAAPICLQDALLDVMMRPVTKEEVNDLKNDIAVLTQFDIQQVNKSRRGPQGNSSSFRGVTKHRRTQRWEAHIWDSKKQVYLGGFDNEVAAAKAHDIMAIKTRGTRTLINFKLNVYESVLHYLADTTLGRDDVIQALRGTSKQMQRATASLKSPRAGRTPPQSPRASPMDDPRIAAAAAALLAAGNSAMDAEPRRGSAFGGAGAAAAAAGGGLTPQRAAAVAAGIRLSQMSHLAGGDESPGDDVMYDQDDVMDDEEMSARVQEVLRRADRVTNRGGRSRPKSALEVMVAAAAESDGGEDGGKEAELVDLLAGGVGKAGRGRGAKGASGRGSNSRGSQPSTFRPPNGTRPYGSPTLPGLGSSPFPAGFGYNLASLTGRMLPPGLYDPTLGLNPDQGYGLYGGSPAGGVLPGLRPGRGFVSPPGYRPPGGLLGESYGQGLEALGNPGLNLTVEPLDMAEGFSGMQGLQQRGSGGTNSEQGDQGVPRRVSHLTSLTTQQLLNAANARIFEPAMGQQVSAAQQTEAVSEAQVAAEVAAAAAAARVLGSTAGGVCRPGLMPPPPLAVPGGPGAVAGGPGGPGGPGFATARSFSFELEQHFEQLPPTVVQQRQQQQQQQRGTAVVSGVPTAAQREALAAVAAAAGSRGVAGPGHLDLQSLLAAATKRHVPGPAMPFSFEPPNSPTANPQSLNFMPDRPLRNVESRPPLGQFSSTAGPGSGSTAGPGSGTSPFSMFGRPGQAPNSGSNPGPGLRTADDTLLTSTPDEAMLIPNMHVGAHGLQTTGALVTEMTAGHQMPLREYSLGLGGFPPLDLSQCHQQQQQQGVSSDVAAEAAAAMAASRAAGRDQAGLAAAAAAAASAVQESEAGYGFTAGYKRDADGTPTAAAAAAAQQGITLPGFPVDEDEVADLEASHHAAAAAVAAATANISAAAAVGAVDMEDPEERAALEAAASAAANAAELQAAAEVARRYTWPGGAPSPGMDIDSGAAAMTARDIQMYSPRFAPRQQVPAAAAAASLLASANAQRLQQQQQQMGNGTAGPGGTGYQGMGAATARVLPGNAQRAQGMVDRGSSESVPFTSPNSVAAMRDAASLAEMAAATAAVMSAGADAPAAAAAAAAQLHGASSPAQLFYREARMSGASHQQQMRMQVRAAGLTTAGGSGEALPTRSSSSGLMASAAATAAAAEAAMAAMAATTESAHTTVPGSMLLPEDSIAFNNQQRQLQMTNYPPTHLHPQQQQQFARQYSSNAASSFSMPSEGTAAAAAALEGLRNTAGYYSSRPGSGVLHYSPTNSNQDLQQQQQQQQQHEYQGPLMAPPARVPNWGAGTATIQGFPSAQRNSPAPNPTGLLATVGADSGDQFGSQWNVGGSSNSKPPLPPAAQAAAAAAVASGAVAGSQAGGGSPAQQGEGGAERILSPAGSGTLRLPAPACLVPGP